MYLLDTCTLLWLVAERSRLSVRAVDALSDEDGQFLVSSISAFEVGVKHRKGRLDLPLTPDDWFERVVTVHGLREIPVDGRIAARSTLLPPHHADPCDRIIVATAREHELAILTPDPLIQAYDEAKTIW